MKQPYRYLWTAHLSDGTLLQQTADDQSRIDRTVTLIDPDGKLASWRVDRDTVPALDVQLLTSPDRVTYLGREWQWRTKSQAVDLAYYAMKGLLEELVIRDKEGVEQVRIFFVESLSGHRGEIQVQPCKVPGTDAEGVLLPVVERDVEVALAPGSRPRIVGYRFGWDRLLDGKRVDRSVVEMV